MRYLLLLVWWPVRTLLAGLAERMAPECKWADYVSDGQTCLTRVLESGRRLPADERLLCSACRKIAKKSF